MPHIHVNMAHAAPKAALAVLLGTEGSYTLLPPFRLAPAFRLFTGFDLPILLAAAQLHRHFDNACIDGVQSGEAGKGAAVKSLKPQGLVREVAERLQDEGFEEQDHVIALGSGCGFPLFLACRF